MTTPTVRTATPADADAVFSVLTLAFSTDPIERWLYPNPQQYWQHFPRLLHAFGRNAFAHGTAYLLDNQAGATIWLPPGSHFDEDEFSTVLTETVTAAAMTDLLALFNALEPYAPTTPHWYLALIGVDPFRQARGFASTLLTHTLSRCDEEHLPVYLESTNPRNTPIYERYGFILLDTVQVGNAPPMFPMLRQPR